MLKVDLAKQSIEFMHFGCLYEGIINWDPRLPRACSHAPANESWSRPLQNLGSVAPMSWICRTLSQINNLLALILRPAIHLWQQFYRFWHSASFNLKLIVDICQLFYRFWHAASVCVSITLQADMNSQADINLQANTRTRLTRPCFFFYLLFLDSTGWHDFTS